MATREGHEVSVTTTGRSDLSAATSAGQGYPGQHHNPSVGSASTGGSSTEIRDDIRRTRAEMDNTVDALSERLRPRHLLDDMLEMFRGSSVANNLTGPNASEKAKEYGSAIFGRLKNNPMPAALIGAGIAWLIFDQARGDGHSRSGHAPGQWRDQDLREHSGSYVDARTGQPYGASYGAEYRGGSGGGSGSAGGSSRPGMLDRAKEAAGNLGEKISDAAGAVKDSITGAVGSAKDSISGAASGTASGAAHLGRQAGDWSSTAYQGTAQGLRRGYQTGRRSFEDALNEYPLAVSVAAMAAGVLTGLLLPGTRTEDELMGEQAARLKEQAKDTGQDLVDRGKQVASTTLNAVAGEAQQQDLTPGSLAEKVKHVARDVVDTAKESARREGLTDVADKAKSVAQHGRDVAKDEANRQKDELKP